MFHKRPIAKAVASLTAASMFAGGISTVAAESDMEIEEVIVTGSRIPVAVSDAPRPVTILDRQEIELSGMENIADVLRSTTYNTFGSFRERSGSSFQQIALINLRGLGEDRTAVLVNGRRVPGNPLTGTAAVDLNSIPLSAVDRIEILTDSASAVYGADAIGGVINVIMRDDYDGFEFDVGTEMPTREGADADHFSFTFGAVGDKSSIVFSGEWYKRNPIFDADREYSQVQVSPGPGGGLPRHGVDTIGVSSGGNTMFELDFSDAFSVGPCPTGSGYVPLVDPEGVTGGTGCGFGYADISMQTGGIDRKSTFLDARYEIAPDHEVYFENRFSDISTFGRYAPAVGFFLVDDEAPLNPSFGTAEQRDLFLFHRFVGHGNRDDSVTTKELDSVAGVHGLLADGAVNYDVYARYYEYNSQIEGDTYVIASIIEDLVADGSYNFINPLDPTNQAAIRQSSATLLRDISTEVTGFGVSVDGYAFDLPSGKIGWAAGAETYKEEYQDQYDGLREAANVLGSAGNSADGSRSRWAAFGELSIPVLDNLEVNIAGRFDDYDDFGSEFSPQVAVRFQPIDEVVLRASWGEGFKAPNLRSLYQALSFSAETITDLTRCNAQGIAEADCPNSQVEEYVGGNPQLQAEQSESFNIGAVINPIDNLSFSVDYFQVEIDEAVDSLDLQDVIMLEQQGSLPPGVIVNRGPTVGSVPGIVTRCEGSPLSPPACGLINVFGNLASVEIEGVDVRAHYDYETDSIGTFSGDVEWSHVITYDEVPIPGAAVISRPGDEEFPNNRINVSVRWQWSDYTVNYALRHTDETRGVTAGSKYDAFTTHDITAVWYTPWDGELSFGVRNLTDEDPSIDSVSGYDDEVTLELYDVMGRVPFISYKMTF